VAHADSPQPKILVAAGPRAAEEAVFAWLEERLDGTKDGSGDGAALEGRLARLNRPLRVVVPSRSLRLHLSAELVRRRGRSAAGVVVQTLHALAHEIVSQVATEEGLTGEPRETGANTADDIPDGEDEPAGGGLLQVLVQRLGREMPELAEPLDELADGYAPVAATVRDFLDAGLEPALADAVAEAAAQRRSPHDPDDEQGEAAPADPATGRLVGTRSERDRAEALVHLAAAVEHALRVMRLELPGQRLRRAADRLEAAPDLLTCRGVLVHGFADATGVATALIEVLLRRLGATVVLDRPPDPAAKADATDPTERAGLETGFTRRFLERLGALAGTAETVHTIGPDASPPPPPVLRTLATPGTDGEARRVAGRVQALIDRGARPEGIGVVARSLAPEQPFARAFRRHFDRLGIPFSGADGGPGGSAGRGPLRPAGRRLRALLDVLRRGEEVPADRWLDSLGDGAGRSAHRPELRLALHSLGAARLADVARIDLEPLRRFEEVGFPLPIREGFQSGDDEGNGGDRGDDRDDREETGPTERALRRRVPLPRLRRAVEDAARLVRTLTAWSSQDRPDRPVADHLAQLRRVLTDELGWSAATETDPCWAPIHTLEAETPGRLEVSYDELIALVSHALKDAGRDALGGAGGGVALLDAMEARGRTFEHLFLVGLNRGVFPRPIREDPLLADDLRRLLLQVLPDLPVKSRGFDEERHLFAQLVAAAPEVTLSWQSATDDGQPHPRSPLIERLEDRLGDPERPEAPDRQEPPAPSMPLRPAGEQALAAGLAGGRDAFERLLAIALREARIETARTMDPMDGTESPSDGALGETGPWRDLAAAHRRVLDELDPDLSTPEGRRRFGGLGPYFGFIGPTPDDDLGDPRRAELWVTTLERLAACPWQTFLGRLLRIEPTPDPLQAAPRLDALLIGSLVHATLEEVVARALPGERAKTLDEADAREPAEVAWPAKDELESILARQAAALLEIQGVALPGLERALAAAARPFVLTAREVEWHPRVPSVLAAEVTGTVTVTDADGSERALHFRADRVDRMVERRFPGLRLTDYKTGRPISTAVRQKTRDEHFLRQVEAGDRLQAVAYALATGGPLPSMHAGQGRYVFLRPELPPEQRDFGVWGSHVPFVEAFAAATRSALAAWDQGAFFPRLVEPDRDQEPRRCAWCPVREACVRGDSGARRRLAEWATDRRQGTLEAGDEPERDRRREAASALLDVWTLGSRSERSGSAGPGGTA